MDNNNNNGKNNSSASNGISGDGAEEEQRMDGEEENAAAVRTMRRRSNERQWLRQWAQLIRANQSLPDGTIGSGISGPSNAVSNANAANVIGASRQGENTTLSDVLQTALTRSSSNHGPPLSSSSSSNSKGPIGAGFAHPRDREGANQFVQRFGTQSCEDKTETEAGNTAEEKRQVEEQEHQESTVVEHEQEQNAQQMLAVRSIGTEIEQQLQADVGIQTDDMQENNVMNVMQDEMARRIDQQQQHRMDSVQNAANDNAAMIKH